MLRGDPGLLWHAWNALLLHNVASIKKAHERARDFPRIRKKKGHQANSGDDLSSAKRTQNKKAGKDGEKRQKDHLHAIRQRQKRTRKSLQILLQCLRRNLPRVQYLNKIIAWWTFTRIQECIGNDNPLFFDARAQLTETKEVGKFFAEYQVLTPDGRVIAHIHKKRGLSAFRYSYSIDITRQVLDPRFIISYAILRADIDRGITSSAPIPALVIWERCAFSIAFVSNLLNQLVKPSRSLFNKS